MRAIKKGPEITGSGVSVEVADIEPIDMVETDRLIRKERQEMQEKEKQRKAATIARLRGVFEECIAASDDVITIQDLSELMGLDKSTIYRMVKLSGLNRRKIRLIDSEGRRQAQIVLTVEDAETLIRQYLA